MKQGKGQNFIWLPCLTAGFLLLLVLSAMAGRFSITPSQLAELLAGRLAGREDTSAAATVLFQSRLPRMAAASLIGCGLSVSGAAYQGVFRNPMISPDILGASAGAGFGAALGLLLGMKTALVQLLAFCGGLLAVALALLLTRAASGEFGSGRLLLVLSGIVAGALFQAFISIVKYAADPFDTMPSIAFWLMGGLTYVTASDVWVLLLPAAVCTGLLMLLRWRINVLSLGDEEAASVGVSPRRYRLLVILCATLMTAASVAVGGMIGWVGLIVPHFARRLAGPDYRRLLPCAALLGAGFLLLVDDLARCLFAQELPIGILTALIGAPVFALLMIRQRRGAAV